MQRVDQTADFVFEQCFSRRLRQGQLQRNVAKGKQIQFVAMKEPLGALTVIGFCVGKVHIAAGPMQAIGGVKAQAFC